MLIWHARYMRPKRFHLQFWLSCACRSMARRCQTEGLTATTVCQALLEGVQTAQLEACKTSKGIFAYNWQAPANEKEGCPAISRSRVDRNSLFEHRVVLKLLLCKGKFSKQVLQKGLELYNKKVGGLLSGNGNMDIRGQAYALKRMCMDVEKTKSNCSTGQRLPDWLKELVDCMASGATESADENASNSESVPPSSAPGTSQPKKKRCILRRVSSTASSTSTVRLLAKRATDETQYYPDRDEVAPEATPQLQLEQRELETPSATSSGTQVTGLK